MRCLSTVVDNQIVLPTSCTRELERSAKRKKPIVAWEKRKRTNRNTGTRRKANIVRESLFEWFSIMRHSVKARFPAKLLEIKAKQLVQDYVVACLLRGEKPDPQLFVLIVLELGKSSTGSRYESQIGNTKCPKKCWKIDCKSFGAMLSGFDI
jgi:hypothetical protein